MERCFYISGRCFPSAALFCPSLLCPHGPRFSHAARRPRPTLSYLPLARTRFTQVQGQHMQWKRRTFSWPYAGFKSRAESVLCELILHGPAAKTGQPSVMRGDDRASKKERPERGASQSKPEQAGGGTQGQRPEQRASKPQPKTTKNPSAAGTNHSPTREQHATRSLTADHSAAWSTQSVVLAFPHRPLSHPCRLQI